MVKLYDCLGGWVGGCGGVAMVQWLKMSLSPADSPCLSPKCHTKGDLSLPVPAGYKACKCEQINRSTSLGR